jgi:hypothetical protein
MAAIGAIPLVTVRRALLFLLDIGVPFTAGIALGQPAGALLGAIAGMVLSFADQEGTLIQRYTILLVVTGGILLGGMLGYVLHDFQPAVWVLFALATFACGAFLGFGKAPVLGARFGAMALVVANGSPAFDPGEVKYLGIAFVTAAVMRTLDQMLAGPLPHLRGGAPRDPAHGWLRFAVCYAGAAVASLWMGLSADPSRALWVVVATLVAMQPDAQASYVRMADRVVGTVFGVVAAFLITRVVHDTWTIVAIVLVVAALIPHHLQDRYWLHTTLIAVLVLLVYDLATANPEILRGLLHERLQDVLIGCSIALVGTVIAFPVRKRRRKPDADALDPVEGEGPAAG